MFWAMLVCFDINIIFSIHSFMLYVNVTHIFHAHAGLLLLVTFLMTESHQLKFCAVVHVHRGFPLLHRTRSISGHR